MIPDCVKSMYLNHPAPSPPFPSPVLQRFHSPVLTFLASLALLTSSATANVSSLADGAESGEGQITKQIDSGYSLIQSTVVALDYKAFRLARNGANDNWFEFNDTIDVQADTKLAFQSQLSWSTTGEVARVQISTNGGSSWIDLHSQTGTNNQVETSFVFREFSLAAYAGQSIKLRFFYEHTGGGWYDISFSTVGWFIDNIQVGSVIEKTLYSVGDPSAEAQLYLEIINRARSDAIVEANRLKNTTDPDILSAYSSFGVSPADIVTQFAWSVSHINPSTGNPCMEQFAQPLSFNEKLLASAQCHSQDMFNNAFQGHTSSNNAPNCNGVQVSQGTTSSGRATAHGYDDWNTMGENVYAYSKSIEHGHAGFNVDWGSSTNSGDPCYNSAFSQQGMQNPAGHRLNIHARRFKEAGIGIVNGSNGGVGPQIVTQDFANTFADLIFVTGCVYEDVNGNNFYDIGEGRSGIRVDVAGAAYYAVSTTSGAYSLPVNGNGSHDVTFTAPGMTPRTASVTVSNRNNVKLDHEPQYAQSYSDWATQNGVTGSETDDDDNDGTINLIEFALDGFDPTISDRHLLPSVVEANGKFTLTINKREGISGVVYTVYVSTDLINWTTTGVTIDVDNATTLVASTPTDGPCKFITYEITVAP
jgi:hypothetical protein